MIQSTVGAASSLLLTGRAGWIGLHVKPPPFTGGWDDQEGPYVVLDLEGAEYNVDLSEKVRGAVPSYGGAATAGDEP
jgi:hypothetical protein